jgi:pimeloyl-ACP methyl ester carboxylesterase
MPIKPPSLFKLALEGRAGLEWAAGLLCPAELFAGMPRGKGQTVLLLPGLLTNDWSMGLLGKRLEAHGYQVEYSNFGFNFGPAPGLIEALAKRVRNTHEDTGRKPILVGWSMGGCMAVATAAQAQEHVERVVTIGSPLAGEIGSSHLGPVFQASSGMRSSRKHMLRAMGDPGDVPVSAIISVDDGLLDWRGCAPSGMGIVETIWMRGVSHLGLPAHPAVAAAVLSRLSLPTGKLKTWKPRDQWVKPFLTTQPTQP